VQRNREFAALDQDSGATPGTHITPVATVRDRLVVELVSFGCAPGPASET
jgi:hypothetical protein